MPEPLDVLLEFEVSDETAELVMNTFGSGTEFFTATLAEEFKNAMHEKLLAKGLAGTRDEVLGKWIAEQAADLEKTAGMYMVPNPIRIKE